MGFGNLGISEMAIIAVLVLLFFGPERIPEMARTVGQLMREFRRGMNEIQRELQEVERSVSEGPGGSESRDEPGPDRGRLEPGAWEDRTAAGPGDETEEEGEPDVQTPRRYRPVQDVPPPGTGEADTEAGPEEQ